MLRVLALGWRSLGVHGRAGLKPVRTYVRRSIRPPWRGRCTSREVGARRRPAPGAGTIGPPLPPPGEARALGQDVREGWSAGRRRQCRSLPCQAAERAFQIKTGIRLGLKIGSVATNSWHGTTTFGTGAQLWEIPPVRGGFVPRGKANGQAAPPTGNNYGILPPARADRPVPNVADLPNVGSNASYHR